MSDYLSIESSQVNCVLQKIRQYEKNLPRVPDEFRKARETIPSIKEHHNLSLIFEVFNRVHVDVGYVLDYIYLYDVNGGQPFVYSRRNESTRIASAKEYFEKYQLPIPSMLLGEEPTETDSRPYLNHITFDHSPEGYLQFALFNMKIRRFYLHWHSNYNERHFILNGGDLKQIGVVGYNEAKEYTETEKAVISNLDIRPSRVLKKADFH
jgi:hypothetical protein